jgi:hypothetical protein
VQSRVQRGLSHGPVYMTAGGNLDSLLRLGGELSLEPYPEGR